MTHRAGADVSGAAALRIRFWGVRGSHPTPGPSTVGIGGNSSCVEISNDQHILIFDAGTGIIGLGHELTRREPTTLHMFFSHTHHDHIEGLRFFEPLYQPGWRCKLYGRGRGAQTLERVLSVAMQPRFFPVSLSELSARLAIRELTNGDTLRLSGSAPITVAVRHSLAHPKIGVVLYRVTCGGKSVVYATDVEAAQGGHDDVVEFARGADVLIHDAQYTDDEYYGGHINKAGWGHSTVRQAAEAARGAGVGRLILFHHDPNHDDSEVRRLERAAREIFPRSEAAFEGLEVKV
jgi:phosphoribosyl 1,2-cyclic phosphodiesterase